MKLFKYLLSLAFVCTCLFSVSYAQSKKVTKTKSQRGIINDTLIYVKKPVKEPGKTLPARKTVKDDVHPVRKNTATKKKTTATKKKSAIKPRENH